MIGAMLFTKNSVMTGSPGARRSMFLDRLDDLLDLFFERRAMALVRIRNEAAHHGGALHQLGNALEEEQREADRHQRLGGPLRQAAGAEGLLADPPRSEEERNAEPDHDDRQREKEERVADQVDPVAQGLGQLVIHD